MIYYKTEEQVLMAGKYKGKSVLFVLQHDPDYIIYKTTHINQFQFGDDIVAKAREAMRKRLDSLISDDGNSYQRTSVLRAVKGWTQKKDRDKAERERKAQENGNACIHDKCWLAYRCRHNGRKLCDGVI